MKHTQDSNSIFVELIGCDVGRADDDKLSRSCNPAGPAALGKATKTGYRGDNPPVDGDCGYGVVSLDMREYPVAI